MSEVYYLDWWLGFSSRVLTKLILKILLKYDHAVFFKEDMTYNIMLVSGLQHNDLILVYFWETITTLILVNVHHHT